MGGRGGVWHVMGGSDGYQTADLHVNSFLHLMVCVLKFLFQIYNLGNSVFRQPILVKFCFLNS